MKKTHNAIKGNELARKVKNYIIDNIDGEPYDKELKTDEEKIKFLFRCFKSEYGHMIDRYGKQRALAEWFSGLPSVISIDFMNYDILNIAKEWGSIPEDATPREEQKILDNWFNLCAVKTIQLFRAYDCKI